ncbi:MAG: TonB-dependent receptor [Saprospiraceae bacterium]|nr:TonB-dependent receptor [Saprospiraceae bacterium]
MNMHYRHLTYCLSLLACLINQALNSQSDTLSSLSTELPTIKINAYSTRSDLIRIPAAVQVLEDTLNPVAYFSMASSLNQAPGVKLEERSPGSYRLSIRGSTLRSPFGIRNVKVYLDGLSLTDGGGNTYLNLLDPGLIQKAELLKGPASSMYGAGAGGVLLLSGRAKGNQIGISYGTYDQFQENLNLHQTINHWDFNIYQGHQQSQGYREQSAMRRDMIYTTQQYQNGKHRLLFAEAYGDLHYETPGGLTLAQQSANPRQARPAAGMFPGAIEQQAAIHNKTIWLGSVYEYQINRSWSFDHALNYWYTDFRNPFITNYEVRFEKNVGWRPVLKYYKSTLTGSFEWSNGMEYLFQGGLVRNYVNNKGARQVLQAEANINGTQTLWFSQVNWNIDQWQLLFGLSSNQQVYKFKGPGSAPETRKESGPVLMPRASVSYSLSTSKALFISAARGNSPPSLAEIRPSSGEYNQELLPEQGWNLEMGYKSFREKWRYSLNLYSLRLRDAIVRRNDAAGVEYFVNAGGADITGVEAWIQYQLPSVEFYLSSAYQPYKFVNYKQRTTDFSGLRVTGVPRFIHSFRINWEVIPSFRFGTSWYYQSNMPLLDANTMFHPSYSLVSSYLSYQLPIHRHRFELTLSGDNLTDTAYSPGPDINAAANRFYNPGLKRNISLGLKWKW